MTRTHARTHAYVASFAFVSALSLTVPLSAQVPVPTICETVYLPELAPPDGTVTPTIAHTFPVGPASTRPDANGQPYPIFYPFDLSSVRESNGDWTVHVTQLVGHPSRALRTWHRVQSVSLISIMAFVYPYRTTATGWEFRNTAGAWIPGVPDGTFLLYETLPHTAPAGVVPSWAYRFDDRTWTPFVGRALSDRLERYAGWNVGIYAPSGIETVGLQVKALICGERQ